MEATFKLVVVCACIFGLENAKECDARACPNIPPPPPATSHTFSCLVGDDDEDDRLMLNVRSGGT